MVMLHTLGYADDVAIIETGDEKGVSHLSERVTAIAKGSKKRVDMDVTIVKTKSLHVVRQQEAEAVSKTTDGESRSKCKFVCPHSRCNHIFLTKRGIHTHTYMRGDASGKTNLLLKKIWATKGQ